MNLRVNTNILPMAQPRVMYSVDSELFFLHTATMYLSPGEVEVEEDEYGHQNMSGTLQRVATDTMCYPIDEEGIAREECQCFEDCIHVGRAGDTVSWFYSSILECLKTDTTESFPFTYEWAKKRLQEYGIQVKEERRERLCLYIYLKSRDSETHYKFEAYCYQGVSNIPFMKGFRKEEYSVEALAKAIVETLKGFFKVYPLPDEVALSVPGVMPGEEENERVKQLVAGSPDVPCKVV